MAENLFPVFDMVDILVEQPPMKEQQYMPAPLFDIEKGEFVLNGANQAMYGSGYDAWVLWCTKTILTERFACLAYSHNMGIETDFVFSRKDKAATEAAFIKTITEALLSDPMGRTQYVSDFDFQWKDDSVYLTCIVAGLNGNSATIEVRLNN